MYVCVRKKIVCVAGATYVYIKKPKIVCIVVAVRMYVWLQILLNWLAPPYQYARISLNSKMCGLSGSSGSMSPQINLVYYIWNLTLHFL